MYVSQQMQHSCNKYNCMNYETTAQNPIQYLACLHVTFLTLHQKIVRLMSNIISSPSEIEHVIFHQHYYSSQSSLGLLHLRLVSSYSRAKDCTFIFQDASLHSVIKWCILYDTTHKRQLTFRAACVMVCPFFADEF